MQEIKEIFLMKDENKFKSIEAERFISEINRIIAIKKARNQGDIAKAINKSSQDFTDIKSGKKDLQKEFLEIVALKFPIDKTFILTGVRSNRPLDLKGVTNAAPYYENISASAGLDVIMENVNEIPSAYIKVPGIVVDAYINVFGDSMYPKYCAGEIIGVKEVQKDDLFFGHAYVVQMSDGEPYIKYIQPGKDENHWSLESENEKYPPRQFHLSKINKIFKIKSVITRASL